MANINVAGLIKEAGKALEEKVDATEKVAAFRELLRLSVKTGEATEEQAAWIAEAFPPRERKSAEDTGE